MIDDLKLYPTYKGVGLPWLSEIPADWRMLRGKNVFRIVDVRSQTGDEELLTVSSNDGVLPRSQKTVTMFKAESYVGHKLCWPGDLVINSLWAWMQGLGFSRHFGLVSSAYSVYRLKPEFAPGWKYLHYLLRSSAYKWELMTRSKGVWLSRLQLSDAAFLDMPIILPPPDEQAAIVRYLDHVDRRIRRYIRAKQRLIALLNEQKQAIIHRAVTRGLDPNVRLKPSGVEWLGDVPEHWEVTRLKFIAAQIVDCLHATPVYSETGLYPAIRTADVQPGRLLLDTARRVDQEQYLRWTARMVPQEGDILYTREGERFGIAALVPANVTLCISQRMMVFRLHSTHNPAYVMWQVNCPHVFAQAAADIIGAAAPHVNVERIQNLWLVLPPRPEQDVITAFLEEACSEPNAAIDRTHREIGLLREYRTRLIADVVTGKLDVREAAVALPEAAGPAPSDENESTSEDEDHVDDNVQDVGNVLDDAEE